MKYQFISRFEELIFISIIKEVHSLILQTPSFEKLNKNIYHKQFWGVKIKRLIIKKTNPFNDFLRQLQKHIIIKRTNSGLFPRYEVLLSDQISTVFFKEHQDLISFIIEKNTENFNYYNPYFSNLTFNFIIKYFHQLPDELIELIRNKKMEETNPQIKKYLKMHSLRKDLFKLKTPLKDKKIIL